MESVTLEPSHILVLDGVGVYGLCEIDLKTWEGFRGLYTLDPGVWIQFENSGAVGDRSREDRVYRRCP